MIIIYKEGEKLKMIFVFEFFFYATVGAFLKYWVVKWLYIGLAVVFIIEIIIRDIVSSYFRHIVLPAGNITIFIIFTAIIAVGIFMYFKSLPEKWKIQDWNFFMEKLKLSSSDRSPYFLYEKQITVFAYEIAFKTTIPLKVWQAKKNVIEMHLNKKILMIMQDRDNNQIIKLIVQSRELPSLIEWERTFLEGPKTELVIGFGCFGASYIDLTKYPHAFIAGETGSGKSNLLKCLIHQAIAKDYEVVLIDFKRGVSFSAFSDYLDICYDYPSVTKVLKDMVDETNRRLDLFRDKRVDNINSYNISSSKSLKRKIIFIDELAELLKTRDKSISNSLYDSLETLTRLSRAVGIHLIMGIQRPDSTIISGQIKNNVSFRICGRFVDPEPSRIMLGSDEASHLPNIKGRFIVKDDDISEVQALFYHDSVAYSLPSSYMKNHDDGYIAETEIEKPIKEVLEPIATVEEKSAVTADKPLEIKPEKPLSEIEFDFSDISG